MANPWFNSRLRTALAQSGRVIAWSHGWYSTRIPCFHPTKMAVVVISEMRQITLVVNLQTFDEQAHMLPFVIGGGGILTQFCLFIRCIRPQQILKTLSGTPLRPSNKLVALPLFHVTRISGLLSLRVLRNCPGSCSWFVGGLLANCWWLWFPRVHWLLVSAAGYFQYY